ncbi:hypothetical protein Poli38472_013533 [Pythium oligandrum]|uniref:Protein kinase domain-containing protein n=1 Tax=Pythium oligandrum TaxID=41045 RepID=A0A8K1C7I3_PYTOL|nr:hypothetical protein Poli38472_013533 [Pythium oligandrum]|eukprot:TMW58059.1 hypothetical protein Poli38472_013533 [Pythium oligandrum]
MHVKKVLAVALLGVLRASADDASPAPPANAPLPTVAESPANPPIPGQTTAPPITTDGTRTPSPEATVAGDAMSTSVAEAAELFVPAACTAGRFQITNVKALATCEGGVPAPLEVNPAKKISLKIETAATKMVLEDSTSTSVEEVTIYTESSTSKVPVTVDIGAFPGLTALKTLTFRNVNFSDPSVYLKVAPVLTTINLESTNAEDLSLSMATADSVALKEVKFIGSSFPALPTILSERKYPAGLTVTGSWTIKGLQTELSPEAYSNLKANVGDTLAGIFGYSDSCSEGSITDKDRPVVCKASVGKGKNSSSSSSSGSASGREAEGRSSSSDTTLTIIVIIVALIAAGLAYFVARRYFCQSGSGSSSPQYNDPSVGLISKDETHGHNKLSFISSDDALREIRLEQHEVSISKSMGTGRIWAGEHSGRKVVIKRVEAESTDSHVTKALISQARSLAPLSHPNLVSLVGVAWIQGTDFGIVAECLEKGSLRSVLLDLDTELELQTKLNMCLDIASALMYLHHPSRNMYMRRLSSRKVLVNGTMDCKINLFDCHPFATRLDVPEAFGIGEMAWWAPELVTRKGSIDPRKVNIYALGVIMGEIFTRHTPYHNLVDAIGSTLADVELLKRIRREERLLPHENRREMSEIPAMVRDVVDRCLAYSPARRPSAEEVVVCLESAKGYSERHGSTTSL